MPRFAAAIADTLPFAAQGCRFDITDTPLFSLMRATLPRAATLYVAAALLRHGCQRLRRLLLLCYAFTLLMPLTFDTPRAARLCQLLLRQAMRYRSGHNGTLRRCCR